MLWSDWIGPDRLLQGLACAARSINGKKSWWESNARRSRPVPSSVQRSALLLVVTCIPPPLPDWLTPSHPLRTSYNSPNAFAAFKRCFCCHGDLLAFKSHSESNPSAEGEAKSVGEENAWAWVWAEPARPPTCQQTPVPSPRCRPGPEMFFFGSGMKAFLTAEERSATSGPPEAPRAVGCPRFRQ